MEKKIFDHNFLSLATILYLSDSIVHLKGAVLSYRKFSLRPTHLHYLHYTTLPTPTYPPHLSLVNAVKRPEILQQEKTFDIFPKMFFSPVYIGQKDLVSARERSFDRSFGCQTPEPPPDTRPRLACNCQGPFLSSPDMSDLL